MSSHRPIHHQPSDPKHPDCEATLDTLRKSFLHSHPKDPELAIIKFGLKLIQMVNHNQCSIEQAAYALVCGLMELDTMTKDMADIFNAASEADIPRVASYHQPLNQHDTDLADQLKQSEWQELQAAILTAAEHRQIQ